MLIWRKLLVLFYITEPFLTECKSLTLNELFEGFIVVEQVGIFVCIWGTLFHEVILWQRSMVSFIQSGILLGL